MEMAKLIALLLTGWTLLGLSKGLRCYCNTTASILVNVDCLNERSCETDYMCAAQRYYNTDDQRYVTVWECLTLALNNLRIQYQLPDSCNGDMDTNQTSYKCCSDSEYCNRHLDVTVPDEVPTSDVVPTSVVVPTSGPTTVPSVPSPSPDTSTARLKCYCNDTDRIVSPLCYANNFTCETEGACMTRRYINQMGKLVTSWYCQPVDEFLLNTNLCDINNTRLAIRCCNSSNYCNRGITLRLPNEQLATTDPATTGTTEVEFTVNRPTAGAPESLLYVWLTMGVIGLAFIAAAVGLAVCIGVTVHYYRVKRKVALSRAQFNTVTCKTIA